MQTAHPSHTEPSPIVRRRLAGNIICMYNDDRPPVVNCTKRRGRRPRNVIRFYVRPLEIGDICELCRGAIASNPGKRVRIIGWDSEYGEYEVKGVREMLDVRIPETGEPDGQRDTANIVPTNLRRVSSLCRGSPAARQ